MKVYNCRVSAAGADWGGTASIIGGFDARSRFRGKIALGLFALASASLHAEDWPMYGRNLSHTFSNPDSGINPSNVASLQLAWTFPTGDAVSASPTVVGGVVYVGSWDGYFYALDAKSCALKWKFRVDCQYSVLPIPPHCLPRGIKGPPRTTTDGGIITSSAAVAEISNVAGITRIVYFGAGKTLYALNAKDGSLRWKRVICGNPDFIACAFNPLDPTRIFSSPAVFGGLVFVGHTVDGVNHYRGGFEAIEAATGRLRWRFEVDPKFNSRGQVIGGFNRGCGSVWSSAAVDTNAGLVFFDTGDCHEDATPPYHEAVIALAAASGTVRWVFRPRQTDTCDFDFGASPNIIDLGSERFLGVGGKDGTYYLLNRLTQNPAGEVIWHTNVVFGGLDGGFFGAAFDEQHQQIFGATGIGDGNPFTLTGLCSPGNPRDTFLQEPSMHALNAADGGILWERSMNHSFGATSLGGANPQGHRVVFSGLVGVSAQEVPALKIYDAQSKTGDLLKTLLMPVLPGTGSINSAATPVGNMLFVTSGNSFDGKGSGVHAFTLSLR
jgi:outer membrane protein assembly factor BamB